jgi:hypothetical protein
LYINLKMINLTDIITILNFVYTIVIYAVRRAKLDLTAYILKKFKTTLDSTYICFNFFVKSI